jgi:hypothetical protein
VLRNFIIGAGALAAATGSIMAVGSTVAGWLDGGPEGTVQSLRIQSIRPLSYGEWREHEDVPTTGIPAAELKAPGKLVTFELVTKDYGEDDVLPVRIIVHDVTHRRSETTIADPARVRHGKDCGCVDWVPVPPGRTTYYLEVAVFPPGPIRGDPLKSVASNDFRAPGSGAATS